MRPGGGKRYHAYRVACREVERVSEGMARFVSKYAEGMHRLAEQWPYLRYLGMGAWWAWIWLCYSGTGLFALAGSGEFAPMVGRMYLFSTPAIMLALILAALEWRHATPLLSNAYVVVGVSLIAVVGTVLIDISMLVGGPVLFAAGGIMTGAGTSVLALKTGDAYGTLGSREVLTAGSISLVFASFLYFMGTGLPATLRPFFIAAMPLVAALFFVMPGEDNPFPADARVAQKQGRHLPGMRTYVHIVLAGTVVAATAGFAKGVAAASISDGAFGQVGALSTFIICLVALVVCAMVNSGDIVRSVRKVYALLILLGVAVVFASVFGASLAYLGIGKEPLWMMFTCLMAYTSFRFGFSPVRAFGFGQAAYLGASAASWGLGMLCAPLLGSSSAHLVLVAAMMLVIALLFVFVFTDADIKFIFTWRPGEQDARDLRPPNAPGIPAQGEELAPSSRVAIGEGAALGAAPAVPDGTALEARIAGLPERLGISSREAQIMLLFAQGHSANWIAEDLVISKNTVRSHIRSIYTKLDVHSRRELLDYLGASGPATSERQDGTPR